MTEDSKPGGPTWGQRWQVSSVHSLEEGGDTAVRVVTHCLFPCCGYPQLPFQIQLSKALGASEASGGKCPAGDSSAQLPGHSCRACGSARLTLRMSSGAAQSQPGRRYLMLRSGKIT